MGSYYEAFDKSAKQLRSATGYKLKRNWRHFNFACGFHKRYLPKVKEKMEQQNVSFVIINQTGKYLSFTMERLPVKRVEFVELFGCNEKGCLDG